MTGSKESMLCLKNVIFHACAREGCTGQVNGGTFCSKEKFSSDILCSQMSLEECNELFISVSPLVKRSCQSDLECIYWSRLKTVQPYHVTSFFHYWFANPQQGLHCRKLYSSSILGQFCKLQFSTQPDLQPLIFFQYAAIYLSVFFLCSRSLLASLSLALEIIILQKCYRYYFGLLYLSFLFQTIFFYFLP